jgi:hypothetical protein
MANEKTAVIKQLPKNLEIFFKKRRQVIDAKKGI